MTLSPAGRGLALSAVSALTITGLALGPAPARAADAGAVWLSQSTPAGASTKADALQVGSATPTSGTVRLTAERSAGVTGDVAFEYNSTVDAGDDAGGWTAIAGARAVGDLFVVDWTVPPAVVGSQVSLRTVVPTSGGSSYSYRRGITIHGQDEPEEAVFVSPDQERGFFAQPYSDVPGGARTLVPVSGSTSATGGEMVLSWRGEGGSFQGETSVPVFQSVVKAPGESQTRPGGSWSGALDIRAYTPQPGDELAIKAVRSTDHVDASLLYQQTVTSIEGQYTQGGDPNVRLTVLDQEGQPVTGAEVRRASDGGLVGYTGADGRVGAQLASEAETYYVNATDADEFAASQGDQEVTVLSYTQTATAVDAVLDDGAAFDRDEYADGDIGFVVRDQNGRRMNESTQVYYRAHAVGSTPPAEYRTADTDDDGRAAADLDVASMEGVYQLDFRLAPPEDTTAEDDSELFRTGEARLRLVRAGTGAVRPGGRYDYDGVLVLGGLDEAVLPGRRVTLTYSRGYEVVPGSTPDAGILQGGRRVATASAVTDADGRFSVSVGDAVERPAASELGGRLTARTADNVASGTSTLDGNAGAATAVATPFDSGRGRGRVTIALGGADNGARADVLRVTGPTAAAGETVRVYRVVGRRQQLVATRRLDRGGDVARVVVADRNRAAVTRYVARLLPSKRVQAAISRVRALR